jgi:dimethylargininase
VSIPAPAHAWVREVPASFGSCLRAEAVPIDVDRARAQHGAYVEALRAAGVPVTSLPRDDGRPDSCFVEDAAVIWDGGGIVTRPGAPSRRPETASIAEALGLASMSAPATLDGGDVLRTAGSFFVGRSARTNEEGIEALRRVAPIPVVAVEVGGGLHLKSAITLVDQTTAVHRDDVDPEPFEHAGLRLVAVPEPAGANVLALGNTVLVSASAPATATAIAARGFDVVTLTLTEIHAGDGALTCLSLRAPAPRSWCA